MRARLTGVLAVAALALAAPPALAQDPLPTTTPSPTPTASPSPSATPTPTPTPTAEEQARAARDARDRKAKGVRRIYRDFERDGRIDDCDHTEKALKRARRSIADSYAEQYPDFRDALTAALERHRDGKCVEATPTPSATAGPSPSGTGTTPAPPAATPAPAPAPPPSSTPDSGTLPGFGGGSGGSSGSGGGSKGSSGGTLTPPGEGDIPEGTLPAPTPAATPQALPPKLVVTRAGTAPSLFVPGTLLAIALLGLLIAALTGVFAKRTGRLAGVGHAWREAAWRTSGTWTEFTDWLRTGR